MTAAALGRRGDRGQRSGRPKTLGLDQRSTSGFGLGRGPRLPACFARPQERDAAANGWRSTGQTTARVTVVNGLGVPIDSLYYVDDRWAVVVRCRQCCRPARSGCSNAQARRQSRPRAELSERVFDQPWNMSLQELGRSPEKLSGPGLLCGRRSGRVRSWKTRWPRRRKRAASGSSTASAREPTMDVKVDNLKRHFGGTKAVDGISLHVLLRQHLRICRAQRGRQDHDHAHPGHARRADRAATRRSTESRSSTIRKKPAALSASCPTRCRRIAT